MTNDRHDILLFTTCKAFDGEFSQMQENAIASWRANGFDVLIIGNEAGVESTAHRLGCYHIPRVERDARGVPYIASLFEIASSFSAHQHIAYLNADIIMGPTFSKKVTHFITAANRPKDFLFVTRRRNVPLFDNLFDDPKQWQDKLARADQLFGTWDPPYAIDVFLMNKGWLTDIPPLTIGRAGWDNWMLLNAKTHNIAVIDGSHDCPVYHPPHGYALSSGGLDAVTIGEQASENRRPLRGQEGSIVNCATHILKDGKTLPVTPQSEVHGTYACDTSKRLSSDLEMMKATSSGDTEKLLDNLRTLLWRANVYVPPPPKKPQTAPLLKTITAAEKLLTIEHNADAAIAYIQDNIGAELVKNLGAIQREIIIWGTSTAADRMYDFLTRNKLLVSAFVDGTLDTSAVKHKELAGHKYNVFSATHAGNITPAPFFLIASIHRDAIKKQLRAMQFGEGADYI